MRLYLDDINYTADVDGLDNLQITEEFRNSTGQQDKKLSSQLRFKDAAADYIKDKLITDCGKNQYIDATIYDDCCNISVFTGLLRGDAIQWNNENCVISGRLIEKTETSEAYNCLRTTTVADALADYLSFDLTDPIPFGFGAVNILTARAPNTSINFVQFLAPFIREYLLAMADHCEVDLQCSIFNSASSPYYNAIHVFRQTNGSQYRDGLPIQTCRQFLDNLSGLYNLEWRVKDGRLIVERRDYYKGEGEWINYSELVNKSSIDYSFTGDKKYAYMDFSYSVDGNEVNGDETLALSYGRYADIVEWNDPPSPLQEDEYNVRPVFGGINFELDGINPDFDPSEVDLDYPIFERGIMSIPKIYIIDENGVTSTDYTGATFLGVDLDKSQNYPMWFNADIPEVIAGESTLAYYEGDDLIMSEYANLYQNFWYIDDPRREDFECTEATFTFAFDCDDLLNYDITKGVTIYGQTGRIDKIVFNYGTRTAEVTVAL